MTERLTVYRLVNHRLKYLPPSAAAGLTTSISSSEGSHGSCLQVFGVFWPKQQTWPV